MASLILVDMNWGIEPQAPDNYKFQRWVKVTTGQLSSVSVVISKTVFYRSDDPTNSVRALKCQSHQAHLTVLQIQHI